MKTKSVAKTGKHICDFTRSKPSATVDTCYCGKFRHNENNKNEPIVAIERDGAVGEHTPTPWKVVADNDRAEGYQEPTIVKGFKTIATVESTNMDTSEQTANAAFIVRAVNSHDELIDMLHNMLRAFGENMGAHDQMAVLRVIARAKGVTIAELAGLKAIAKAEGK